MSNWTLNGNRKIITRENFEAFFYLVEWFERKHINIELCKLKYSKPNLNILYCQSGCIIIHRKNTVLFATTTHELPDNVI